MLLGVGELVVLEKVRVAEGQKGLVLFDALRGHEVFVEPRTVSVVVEDFLQVVVGLRGLSAKPADQLSFGPVSQPLTDHSVRVAFSFRALPSTMNSSSLIVCSARSGCSRRAEGNWVLPQIRWLLRLRQMLDSWIN